MSDEPDTRLDELTALMHDVFGTEPNGTAPPVEHEWSEQPILFEPLREFLHRKLPPSESLMGVTRDGTNLLPRFGWVMPWGREGSGKTSVMVDLIFHAAAGLNWLVYPVERPLRIVCVVNEGIPGGLQDKLAQKIERWEGDVDSVLDNVAVYVSPWGEFTFREAEIVRHARDYVVDFQADYVALDPLHTLGTTGAGSPQETEEFKHVLRHFGLWEDLGVITAHHSNKTGMVSGDWARHADTVLHLEKDGPRAATKLTLQKARPADPNELGVPVLLKWKIETLSYEREVIPTTSTVDESKAVAQALAVLADTDGWMALEPLAKQCEGNTQAVREVLKRAVKEGLIANVAEPAKPGKRQTWRLTLPTNVSEAQTFQTFIDVDEAQTGTTEPSDERPDVSDVPDVRADPPADASRTSTSHPLIGGDVVDVGERADEDGDVEHPINPLL